MLIRGRPVLVVVKASKTALYTSQYASFASSVMSISLVSPAWFFACIRPIAMKKPALPLRAAVNVEYVISRVPLSNPEQKLVYAPRRSSWPSEQASPNLNAGRHGWCARRSNSYRASASVHFGQWSGWSCARGCPHACRRPSLCQARGCGSPALAHRRVVSGLDAPTRLITSFGNMCHA